MYTPSQNRYESARFNRCGRSGLMLPAVSLGLWHNFGGVDGFETGRQILLAAFDRGVIHFDLANNYGPPPGSAEEMLGRVLRTDLGPSRDELIISTKAGYLMWPGPCGEFGGRKHMIASLDQSLHRLGLDYVDIFYSHRPDPETPLEETMGALAMAVQQGKALYVGLSNYPTDATLEACSLLRGLGVKCLIHQPSYSMLDRWVEEGLLDALEREGLGCIAYSPLAQGLLTDRYRGGVPEGSRVAKSHGFLTAERLTPELLEKVERLAKIAQARGQSLAQMSLAWVLRDPRVTSLVVGASSIDQLQQNLDCLTTLSFSVEELRLIDAILGDQ